MRRGRWLAGYVAAQLGFLTLLRIMAPRFFWVDDEQAQFVPTFHWFGHHLSGIRPPLMAPGLGAAGNFVADPQYGVYDPVHWLISWGVSRFDHLNLAAWLLGCLAVLVLGLGIWAVLSVYRCPPPLAAAVSLGVASTGFFLWFGGSWWPLMWSTAWLPWLWYGVATRGRLGVMVTGVSAYMIIVAGYPYNYAFAAVIVLAQLAERALSGGSQALRARDTTMRLLAAAAGVLAGAPTILSALQMLPFATRHFATTALGNPGTFIPNLGDVLIGGSTLTPGVSQYWDGTIVLAPIAATAAFALPAIALISWRHVWRRPGIITAGLLLAVATAATQSPTNVGPLRYPFRYLTLVGLGLPLLVALGLTYARTVTKRRLAGAGGLLVLQWVLAVSRAPALASWHLVALAVGGVATAAVVALTIGAASPPQVRFRHAMVVVAPFALILSSFGGAVVGERSAEAAQSRIEAASGQPASGAPARSLQTRPAWGSTIADFRRQSLLADTEVTVLAWKDDLAAPDAGWGSGVLLGNANLLVDLQTGVGYTAAAQGEWVGRACIDFIGQYQPNPGCVDRILQPVPSAGDGAWIDLASSDVVLLSPAAPAELRAHFERAWIPAGPIGTFGYQRYLRPPPQRLPGRVTATTGDADALGVGGGSGGPGFGGKAFDSYVVSTGSMGGSLVMRVPYWPGLRATIGGRSLPVAAVEGTLTSIALPPTLDRATVRIQFRPVGERILLPCFAVAILLVGVAAVACGRRDGGAGTAPEIDEGP